MSKADIMTSQVNEKKQWKKTLYENHEFPDNYTDITFLYELKKNIHLRQLSFKDTFAGAGLVTRELSIVILFSVIFVYLYNNIVEPFTILLITLISTILGYTLYIYFYNQNTSRRSIKKDINLTAVYVIFGYFISPILKTLTESISTDSIFITSVIMMLIHLTFYNYNPMSCPSANVSTALSFNSALFASLCLASRLSTSFHVFVLLTVSVSFFALFPPLANTVGRSNIFLVLSILITCTSLFYISPIFAMLFVFVVFNLNILIPYLIVKWQKYKENIYGPWDEADLTNLN